MKTSRLLASILCLALAACKGVPDGSTSFSNPQYAAMSGAVAPLSQAELDALSDEQQYQVANKLLGTMMKGMPVDEFFDISQGMQTLQPANAANLMASTHQALLTSLPNSTKFTADTRTNEDYRFTDGRPQEEPLAQLYEYPLSKDLFDRYVAYLLMNTILFSPAEEIDSSNMEDVFSVYNKLVQDLRFNRTIRQVVSRHQRSLENWRRFRSPEDNTREMIEIYLGLFDRDEDVPKASIACQDLYLTDEDDGYLLISDGDINTTPQLIFGNENLPPYTPTFITRCNDFYSAIAGHPLLIPRVASVLVDYFMQGRDSTLRTQMVQDIVNSGAQGFQEIVAGIIFSREYLLLTERPKSFEEAFFSTSAQIGWDARRDIWRGMGSGSGSISKVHLEQMGWPTMTLKLGRVAGIPLDAFAFANYHKGLREALMIDRTQWRNRLITDQVMSLGASEFIDYLFLSAAMRRALPDEQTDLTSLLASEGHLTNGNQSVVNGRHDDIAQIVFDYISRLPEIYHFNQITAN